MACCHLVMETPANLSDPSSAFLAPFGRWDSAMDQICFPEVTFRFLVGNLADRPSLVAHQGEACYLCPLALAVPSAVSSCSAVRGASAASDSPEVRGCRSDRSGLERLSSPPLDWGKSRSCQQHRLGPVASSENHESAFPAGLACPLPHSGYSRLNAYAGPDFEHIPELISAAPEGSVAERMQTVSRTAQLDLCHVASTCCWRAS